MEPVSTKTFIIIMPEPPSYESVLCESKNFVGTLTMANVDAHDWLEIRKIQKEQGFLFDFFNKEQKNMLEN